MDTIVVSGSFSVKHPIERGFADFVERRRRFVEEQPVGLGEKHAHDGDPLLLAAGEAAPSSLLVEPLDESRNPSPDQRVVRPGAIVAEPGPGRRSRERPHRDVGPLRQQHHRRAARHDHLGRSRTARCRQWRDQRRLAGPRWAGDSATSPATNDEAVGDHNSRTVRQSEGQSRRRMSAPSVGDVDAAAVCGPRAVSIAALRLRADRRPTCTRRAVVIVDEEV